MLYYLVNLAQNTQKKIDFANFDAYQFFNIKHTTHPSIKGRNEKQKGPPHRRVQREDKMADMKFEYREEKEEWERQEIKRLAATPNIDNLRTELEDARAENRSQGFRDTMKLVGFVLIAGGIVSAVVHSLWPIGIVAVGLALVFCLAGLAWLVDLATTESKPPKTKTPPIDEEEARRQIATEIVKVRGGTRAHRNDAEGAKIGAFIFGPGIILGLLAVVALAGLALYGVGALALAIFF